MSAPTIDRSAIGTNDDGTGTVGTVINTTYVGASIYDKIDALSAALYAALTALVVTGLPRCIAYHNTTQSVASGSFAMLNLNSEDQDTATMHDLVTNNTRITIPASQGGTYFVRGSSRIAGYSGGTQVSLAIFKNASQIGGETHANVSPAAQDLSTTKVLALAAGDFIELGGFQDSGGAVLFGAAGRNISTELTVFRIV